MESQERPKRPQHSHPEVNLYLNLYLDLVEKLESLKNDLSYNAKKELSLHLLQDATTILGFDGLKNADN